MYGVQAFHKAELHLLDVLAANKADVETTYGDLILTGVYQPSNYSS